MSEIGKKVCKECTVIDFMIYLIAATEFVISQDPYHHGAYCPMRSASFTRFDDASTAL